MQLYHREWHGPGDPVLLIHGLASTHNIWSLVAPHLQPYRKLIAPDLRGHGQSDQPDTGYDFATIAQDIVHFIHAHALQPPISIVGHSWGAYVALYLAACHASIVRDVALIDGGIMDLKTQWPTWEIAEQKMTPPAMHQKTVDDLHQMIREHWLKDAWTPEIAVLAFHSFKVDEAGFVQPRLARTNHMQIAKAIWQMTPSDYYASIHCPVLLVVPIPPGMATNPDGWQRDKRSQVEAAQQQLKNVRVAWMEETIHDVPWQRPQELAHILVDFWNST